MVPQFMGGISRWLSLFPCQNAPHQGVVFEELIIYPVSSVMTCSRRLMVYHPGAIRRGGIVCFTISLANRQGRRSESHMLQLEERTERTLRNFTHEKKVSKNPRGSTICCSRGKFKLSSQVYFKYISSLTGTFTLCQFSNEIFERAKCMGAVMLLTGKKTLDACFSTREPPQKRKSARQRQGVCLLSAIESSTAQYHRTETVKLLGFVVIMY